MSVIKPRTRGKRFVRHTTRLEHENNETLYAYAEFIGEPPEYVLNQLIELFLAKKDKKYLAWRAEHPHSFVTRIADRRRKAMRRPAVSPRERVADTLAAAPSNATGRI